MLTSFQFYFVAGTPFAPGFKPNKGISFSFQTSRLLSTHRLRRPHRRRCPGPRHGPGGRRGLPAPPQPPGAAVDGQLRPQHQRLPPTAGRGPCARSFPVNSLFWGWNPEPWVKGCGWPLWVCVLLKSLSAGSPAQTEGVSPGPPPPVPPVLHHPDQGPMGGGAAALELPIGPWPRPPRPTWTGCTSSSGRW